MPYKSQLDFFYRVQSLSMNKIIKNKTGLNLVISHSSGYNTNLETFID